MNNITDELLKIVSNMPSDFKGAFNIREDSGCAGRRSTENIRIDSKTDKPGIDIHVKPGTRGEIVYIPACVTHSAVDDLVYNDFYIGAGADVTIVAQRPKLRDYIPQMTRNLAEALELSEESVNVKATTTEGMGFEGEGQGISAQAAVLIEKKGCFL